MSSLFFSYGSAAHDGAAVEEKTASDGGESEEDEGEDPDSAAADNSSDRGARTFQRMSYLMIPRKRRAAMRTLL
jgi:hypothetical protein